MATSNEQKDTAANEAGGGRSVAPTSPQQPPKRRRRRWLRVIGILLAALILLIWLAPYLVSTDAGTGIAVSIANNLLNGRIQIRDLWLSWLGPCKVSGLRVWDPQGREALAVGDLTYAGGLWHAMASTESFEKVTVESSRAVLYVTAEGEVSLAKALSPRKARAKRQRPTPQPIGRIAVSNAAVRIVRTDGREYEMPDIRCEFTLNTLNEINADLRITTAGGGKLTGRATVRDLVSAGKIDIRKASGTVQLETEEPVDLAPLAALAIKDAALAGKAGVTLKAEFNPEQMESTFAVRLAGLEARRVLRQQERPVDVDVAGSITAAGRKLQAKVTLARQADTIATELEYLHPDAPVRLSLAELISAAMEGKDISLPEFTFQAQGQLDLAAVAQALPGLLKIRQDVRVTGGTLRIEDFWLRGGGEPTAKGRIAVMGLSALRGEQPLNWQPISAAFDVRLAPGEGLKIRNANLDAGFAQLAAAGSLRELLVTMDADLRVLHENLSGIFALEPFEVSGRLAARLQTQRQTQDRADAVVELTATELLYKTTKRRLQAARVDLRGHSPDAPVRLKDNQSAKFTVALQTSASELQYEEAGRAFAAKKASFANQGQVILDGRRPVKLLCEAAELAVDDDVAVGASGWFDLRSRTFHGEVKSLRGDLALLAGRAKDLGAAGLEGFAGALDLTMSFDRPDADAPISSSGKAQLHGLKVKGESVGDEATSIDWSDLKLQPKAGSIAAAAVRLTSPVATLHLRNGRMQRASDLEVAGEIAASADLGKCLRLAGRIAKWKDVPAIDGRLDLSTSVGAGKEKGLIASSGKALVRGLRAEGKLVDEKDITLEWSDAEVSPKAGKLAVASVRLDSAFATTDLSNARAQFGEDLLLTGQARLSADLEKVLSVVGSLTGRQKLPAVSGQLDWSGKASSAGPTISADGQGTVKDLQVGIGEKSVREELVEFGFDAAMDQGAKSIALREAKIRSETMTSQLSGTIKQYESEWLLDLAGDYSGSWERITALLHELAPATRETVSLSGRTASKIKVTGPAHRPEIRPAFRQVDAGLDVAWDAADVYGLRMGPARLSPVLSDGQVKLPIVEIGADGGKIRLRSDVEFPAEGPMLRIPEKLQLLEDIEINPKLGKHLLSRFNPIFAEMATVQGKVSLTVEKLSLPLDERIKRAGNGRGHLDLSKLKVRPEGILATLLGMGGLAGDQVQAVKVDAVDFEIKDGRIEYKNFTMVFGEILDLAFHGSVGFDDTLDLGVSVPVRAKVLERFGVMGPIAEYARVLEGLRVDVPIVGTRMKPRLDLSKVNILDLLSRAQQLLLAEEARKQLERILQPKKREADTRPAEPPATQPTTKPTKQKTEEMILDLLLDLLDNQRDKPDRDQLP